MGSPRYHNIDRLSVVELQDRKKLGHVDNAGSGIENR